MDRYRAQGVTVLEISVLSLSYVKAQVRARQSGAAVDPTGYTVQAAFTAPGTDPVSGDWKSAGWETDAGPTPDIYYARCLVGPGGAVALTVGTYEMHLKITATPEIPVITAGPLKVV